MPLGSDLAWRYWLSSAPLDLCPTKISLAQPWSAELPKKSPFTSCNNNDEDDQETLTTMVRKLKHHEQKLLKKVDFVTYKKNEHRDAEVIRRYMIQKPEDYHKYNRLCGVSFSYIPKSRPYILLLK